jgi:hypothetical protein
VPLNLYKRARQGDIVYIPVSRAMLAQLEDWSRPVQLRVEPDSAGHPLVRQLATRRPTGLTTEDATPITSGQRKAFYAKSIRIDRRDELDERTTKAACLKLASEVFGRNIASTNDLRESEASWALDLLELALEQELSFEDAWRSVASAPAAETL